MINRTRIGMFAFWAAPALVATLGMRLVPSRLRPEMTVAEIFLAQLALWLPWGIWTFVVFRVADRFPFERRHLGRALSVHLPLLAVVVVSQILIVSTVAVWCGLREPLSFTSTIVVGLRQIGDLFTVIYCGIVVAHGALRWNAALREQQLANATLGKNLLEAQLRALQAQLRPHFLFNALNSIVVLIERDPAAAQQAVMRLSELLRATLRVGDSQQIPLAQELELTRLYVEIEQLRFSDRLQVNWRVSETIEKPVPALLLQPLVENAIVHGIGRKRGPGTISIEAAIESTELLIRVTDDGIGLDAESGAARYGGLGLKNLRERLARLYGGAASLELRSRQGGGAAATVRLPL